MYRQLIPALAILPVLACVWGDYSSSNWDPELVYKRPQDHMVDLTNSLGVAVLQDYAYSRSNFAFSPYGVASVLVVLYEGARGESARQIHAAMRFPWNRDITRIGFRDIHRHLRSYFTHEGYLSGLTLNKNSTSLLPEYRRVLRFYGYDVALEASGSDPSSTTPRPDATTTEAFSTTTITETAPTDITDQTTMEESMPTTTPNPTEETYVTALETTEESAATTTLLPTMETFSTETEDSLLTTTLLSTEEAFATTEEIPSTTTLLPTEEAFTTAPETTEESAPTTTSIPTEETFAPETTEESAPTTTSIPTEETFAPETTEESTPTTTPIPTMETFAPETEERAPTTTPIPTEETSAPETTEESAPTTTPIPTGETFAPETTEESPSTTPLLPTEDTFTIAPGTTEESEPIPLPTKETYPTGAETTEESLSTTTLLPTEDTFAPETTEENVPTTTPIPTEETSATETGSTTDTPVDSETPTTVTSVTRSTREISTLTMGASITTTSQPTEELPNSHFMEFSKLTEISTIPSQNTKTTTEQPFYTFTLASGSTQKITPQIPSTNEGNGPTQLNIIIPISNGTLKPTRKPMTTPANNGQNGFTELNIEVPLADITETNITTHQDDPINEILTNEINRSNMTLSAVISNSNELLSEEASSSNIPTDFTKMTDKIEERQTRMTLQEIITGSADKVPFSDLTTGSTISTILYTTENTLVITTGELPGTTETNILVTKSGLPPSLAEGLQRTDEQTDNKMSNTNMTTLMATLDLTEMSTTDKLITDLKAKDRELKLNDDQLLTTNYHTTTDKNEYEITTMEIEDESTLITEELFKTEDYTTLTHKELKTVKDGQFTNTDDIDNSATSTEGSTDGADTPASPMIKVVTSVDTELANLTASKRSKRAIRGSQSPMFPDISLQLQNGMFDSQVARGNELYQQLPRYPFLIDGVSEEYVPVMTYTATFPFAYISRLHALALEFPLDDERYKLLLLLPVERRGLRQLIYDLSSYPLCDVYKNLQPTRVSAIIPSFMVEGFVILTPTLQQLGIWDVFDPRRANLSGMSNDPELYVRNIEQAVTVVIRNYVKILDIQTRTMAARSMTERFVADHPFLYFVMDTDTHVSLMAGKIVDPLNSRVY